MTDDQPRERVVVALTGGPEGDTLIRRAARIADRTTDAELLAVHVARRDGLAHEDPAALARQRTLVEDLGGTYHLVVGDGVARALLEFADGSGATQLVLGASRRGRFAQLRSPGVASATVADAGAIDVHLVAHEEARRPEHVRWRSERALSAGRRAAGFALAAVGLPLLTVVLLAVQPHISLPTDILAFLVGVVAVALVGGFAPALVAAVVAFLLLNYWFTQPLHRFDVADRENVFALAAFLLVALAVSSVVDLAARRTREASAARAEAATLSTLAGSVLRGRRPLQALLEQLRETFALEDVTLLELQPGHDGGAGAWHVATSVGPVAATAPTDGDAQVRVDDVRTLVLRGHTLAAADRRVIEAFAAAAAVALRQERLAEEAARAEALAEVDRLRTALLNAVSHDLRAPLASATAAVSSLRGDVYFGPEAREELLATAEESLDRLRVLLENLLDMSRLQAGALALAVQAIDVGDVVAAAVRALGPAARDVAIRVPDDAPEVVADPGLLERALANVVANALRYSPPGVPPVVTAGRRGTEVEIRVVDAGPGVPREDWDRIFLPFQRLGDRDTSVGVGLGLALSRGLVEAMGGMLVPSATPGGGLTMTITLPAFARASVPAPPGTSERAEPGP
jgi:two-component system sensor histidine kinase KdpD